MTLKAAGHRNQNISEHAALALLTFYNVLKSYEQTRSNSAQPFQGRKRSARTKWAVDFVREMVSRSPQRSMRKMARDLQVSRATTVRIVKDGLRLKSYNMPRRH